MRNHKKAFVATMSIICVLSTLFLSSCSGMNEHARGTFSDRGISFHNASEILHLQSDITYLRLPEGPAIYDQIKRKTIIINKLPKYYEYKRDKDGPVLFYRDARPIKYVPPPNSEHLKRMLSPFGGQSIPLEGDATVAHTLPLPIFVTENYFIGKEDNSHFLYSYSEKELFVIPAPLCDMNLEVFVYHHFLGEGFHILYDKGVEPNESTMAYLYNADAKISIPISYQWDGIISEIDESTSLGYHGHHIWYNSYVTDSQFFIVAAAEHDRRNSFRNYVVVSEYGLFNGELRSTRFNMVGPDTKPGWAKFTPDMKELITVQRRDMFLPLHRLYSDEANIINIESGRLDVVPFCYELKRLGINARYEEVYCHFFASERYFVVILKPRYAKQPFVMMTIERKDDERLVATGLSLKGVPINDIFMESELIIGDTLYPTNYYSGTVTEYDLSANEVNVYPTNAESIIDGERSLYAVTTDGMLVALSSYSFLPDTHYWDDEESVIASCIDWNISAVRIGKYCFSFCKMCTSVQVHSLSDQSKADEYELEYYDYGRYIIKSHDSEEALCITTKGNVYVMRVEKGQLVVSKLELPYEKPIYQSPLVYFSKDILLLGVESGREHYNEWPLLVLNRRTGVVTRKTTSACDLRLSDDDIVFDSRWEEVLKDGTVRERSME